MAVPYEHVNYDFGAADRLSWALSVAHDKLDSYVRLREGQRGKLLGDPHSDNWQGARRQVFEGQFRPQQNAMNGLDDDLRRMKSAVDNATEAAHAVNKHAH